MAGANCLVACPVAVSQCADVTVVVALVVDVAKVRQGEDEVGDQGDDVLVADGVAAVDGDVVEDVDQDGRAEEEVRARDRGRAAVVAVDEIHTLDVA